MTKVIETLEIHAAHSCNLRCVSCAHFSDQGHRGVLSPSDANLWMLAWHERVCPRLFSILGGEPTMNPQLVSIFMLARKYWPVSRIRIITNGFLLDRHRELPQVLSQDGNAWLHLSVHHGSPSYLDKLRPVADLLESWRQQYGIKLVVLRSFEDWTVRYRGARSTMEPFEDKDQRASWQNCPAKDCLQLFEGKIWKCPLVAYICLQARKYGLSAKWLSSLAYRPLQPSCSIEELEQFFQEEDQPCCSACPAAPARISPPSPLRPRPRLPVADEGSNGPHVLSVLDRLESLARQCLLERP